MSNDIDCIIYYQTDIGPREELSNHLDYSLFFRRAGTSTEKNFRQLDKLVSLEGKTSVNEIEIDPHSWLILSRVESHARKVNGDYNHSNINGQKKKLIIKNEENKLLFRVKLTQSIEAVAIQWNLVNDRLKWTFISEFKEFFVNIFLLSFYFLVCVYKSKFFRSIENYGISWW